MADIIKSRRDTAENWRTANPTLAEGELGFETDTKRYKLGNGRQAWNDLDYRDIDDNIKDSDSDADFSIGDEGGNVLAEFSDGHIRTKNFDSRGSAGAITPYTKLRFANWNIAHFNMGAGITNVINTEEKYNQYLPIYRKIFNQVNADFLSICEFDSPFYVNHPEYTTKRELFPNYKYYKDNATATSNGNWVAFFSHLPLANVREVEFNSHPANAYRYYLVGDLTIGNKTIKVVCTHLTHASPNTYAPAQMQQLIADFANEQYVIILADWNSSPSDFKPLKDAGYSLANNDFLGTLKTSPSSSYEGAMDNIAVKGGSINDIAVINVNEIAGSTLSDHYLIYCDVVFY